MTVSNHQKQCGCAECSSKRSGWRLLGYVALVWVVIIFTVGLGVFLVGCASQTVTPATVAPSQASFDQGGQNSGILGTAPGGFYVTATFRERYRALAGIYGRHLVPELPSDVDLDARPGGVWFIDDRHMALFVQMNLWRKSGRTFPTP